MRNLRCSWWGGYIVLFGLLAFYLSWIGYDEVVYVYTIALAIPGFVIIIIAFIKTDKIAPPSKEILSKEKRVNIYKYGTFGLLATASAIIIISIDQLMINKMIGTDAVGIYSVLFFAGLLVNVPMRGLKRAAVSIIADAWKVSDLASIQMIYTKSVVSQTIIGFYLFVIGWACIGPILTYLPLYEKELYVFFFIGLAQLFEVMAGVNTEIIATSTRYQINTYLNVILAILIVVTNYFFIDEWGIVGASGVTCLALLIINIARWYYLRKYFGFQPFNKKFVTSLLIGLFFVLLVSSVNLPFSPTLNVIIYFTFITVAYWSVILWLSLSEDINSWIIKIKRKLLNKK